MENKKFEVQIKLIILSRNPDDSFRHNVALNEEDKLFYFFVANDKTLSRSLSDFFEHFALDVAWVKPRVMTAYENENEDALEIILYCQIPWDFSLSGGNWVSMESLKNEQYFPLLIDAARRLSYEVV